VDDGQLFLVHVWQARPGFRASARRVDSDVPSLLHSPQELAEFFAHAFDPPPPTTSPIDDHGGQKT